MTGPRDEDLDVGIFDDERHEAWFGYALNSKSHEAYDWAAADDFEGLDQDDDADGED